LDDIRLILFEMVFFQESVAHNVGLCL